MNAQEGTSDRHPLPTTPPILVDTSSELHSLIRRLLKAPRIGVDTESDGFYVYFEKVCLIQFHVEGEDYLVDPLALADLTPLGEVFASPDVEKIFHAAEFDVISLKRDYGFRFVNLFDTMIAARVLGWRRYGLASILEERFGVAQDKRFQRANWGKRPLSREQMAYARLDVHYLPELRGVQYEELIRRKRLGKAQESFRRVCRVPGTRRTFDLDGYLRMRGAGNLTPRQLHVLGALYRFRDEEARRLDRAPFRVIPDRTLVALGRQCPRQERDLRGVKGLSSHLRQRYGRDILRVIRRAQQEPLPDDEPHQPPQRMDPRVRERYQALRAWRKKVAEGEGVEPGVILPNRVLKTLALERPTTSKALVQVPGLGGWSRDAYGEDLLALLRRLE